MTHPVLERPRLMVSQVFELVELLGFESRNKYRVRDEAGTDVAYAAEQSSGLMGTLGRQFFGHWRKFDIHFFTPDRRPFMTAHHPFRWFFQCLEVHREGRHIGTIERRFSIISKRFVIDGAHGSARIEMHSPFWRFWTFPFRRLGREVGVIRKKWSGLGFEIFTDRDTFMVEFSAQDLTADDRALMLAAAVYIDMMFFEQRGRGGVFGD